MMLYPIEAQPITASATGTTAPTASLAAVANRTNYITGMVVTSSGATAAGTPNITLTGTIGGTLNFAYPQVVVTSNNQAPLFVSFEPAIPASASNTALTAAVTLGAGTTASAITLTGYLI